MELYAKSREPKVERETLRLVIENNELTGKEQQTNDTTTLTSQNNIASNQSNLIEIPFGLVT